MSSNDSPSCIQETSIGELTFDALSTEHDGYYVCRADVGRDYSETEKVHVKGNIIILQS